MSNYINMGFKLPSQDKAQLIKVAHFHETSPSEILRCLVHNYLQVEAAKLPTRTQERTS